MKTVRYKAVNPRGEEIFRIAVPGRSIKQADAKARRLFRHKRNIFAGFRDDEGIFHPIRASADYSPRRVGEKPKGKKKPKRRKR